MAVDENGRLRNRTGGTIDNRGTLTAGSYQGSVISNEGLIDNRGVIRVSGNPRARGSMFNSGTFVNREAGRLETYYNGSPFRNSGQIVNDGMVDLFSLENTGYILNRNELNVGGSYYSRDPQTLNAGKATLKNTGTLLGTYFVNQGIVENNGEAQFGRASFVDGVLAGQGRLGTRDEPVSIGRDALVSPGALGAGNTGEMVFTSDVEASGRWVFEFVDVADFDRILVEGLFDVQEGAEFELLFDFIPAPGERFTFLKTDAIANFETIGFNVRGLGGAFKINELAFKTARGRFELFVDDAQPVGRAFNAIRDAVTRG